MFGGTLFAGVQFCDGGAESSGSFVVASRSPVIALISSAPDGGVKAASSDLE